ncbi:MAG: phage tail protein [Thermonemataceae bacterium]|mgnify:CR=1 FL=1
MAADNVSEWPMTRFHFVVRIDGIEDDDNGIACTEVTGLKYKTEFIDYRPGSDPELKKLKIPGLKSYEPITIKKAVFKTDSRFYDWYKDVQSGDDNARKSITIELLDEQHDPIITWTVINAFPSGFTGPDLSSTANEIAFESVELVHEGFDMIVS